MLRIYTGGSCPVGGTAPYNRKSDATAPVAPEQRYDQVQFSSCLDETERRLKETVGHISQEVRTQTTTQELEQLRRQVLSGEYQPNPREIAARMLLMTEDE